MNIAQASKGNLGSNPNLIPVTLGCTGQVGPLVLGQNISLGQNLSIGCTGQNLSIGCTGIVGTGPVQKSELIPMKREIKGTNEVHFICPKTRKPHCPFGPAKRIKTLCSLKVEEEWWIDGIQLSKEYIKKVKSILEAENFEDAPLHMNDEILSYPARWVLRFGDKRDIEGL